MFSFQSKHVSPISLGAAKWPLSANREGAKTGPASWKTVSFAVVSSLAVIILWLTKKRIESMPGYRTHSLHISAPDSSNGLRLSDQDFERETALSFPEHKTFEFNLCNGYANQILSLYHGAIVAIESGRTMVLPRVIMNGLQLSAQNNLGVGSDLRYVGDLWDDVLLKHVLTKHGIKLIEGVTSTHVKARQVSPEQDLLQTVLEESAIDHLEIGCPLLRINSSIAVKYSNLVLDLLAVPPSTKIFHLLQKEMNRIPDVELGFNMLHLRIEDDWFRHCSTWGGRHTWDCLGDYLHLGKWLRDGFAVDNSKPLFIITDVHAVNKKTLKFAAMSLESAGFVVIRQGDFMEDMPREARAILYYHLGLKAETFVGNHVSTLSALLIMQRRSLNRAAIHYNKGSFPLEGFLPFFRVPWIFTVNGQSPKVDNDKVKLAVESLRNTKNSLKPYCIYQGTTSDTLYHWLKKMDVEVILLESSLIGDLWESAQHNLRRNNQHDTLGTSLVGIFLPYIKELREYTYVIYTDYKIYFQRPINLHDISNTLPVSVAMSRTNESSYNTGVMLVNLPYMRQSSQDFLNFLLKADWDLKFPGHGVGIRGALMSFYGDTVSFLDRSYSADDH